MQNENTYLLSNWGEREKITQYSSTTESNFVAAPTGALYDTGVAQPSSRFHKFPFLSPKKWHFERSNTKIKSAGSFMGLYR